MAKRISLYAMAATFCGAVVALGMGPRQCGAYGFCSGGYNTTWQMWLWGAGLGAIVGVVGVAVIDLVVNGRYVLANRTEAKRRRQREEALRKPQDDSA